MSNHKALYEVFYQELDNEAPDSDIVFSLDEAKASAVDFFNEIIEEQFPNTPLLKHYTEIEDFKAAHPHLTQNCWFKELSKSTPEPEAEQPSPSQPHIPFSTEQIAQKLQVLLQTENVFIHVSKLQPLLEQAIEEAQAPQTANPQSDEIIPTEDQVWLVHIGQKDLALYEGENYIDSASKEAPDEVEEILASAQMLAERNKIEIHSHSFDYLHPDWTWAEVDKILIKSGLISNQSSLLSLLQLTSIIKVDEIVTQQITFYDEAFKNYLNRGEVDADVVKFTLNKSGYEYDVYLTVKEIIDAVEIKPGHWICADLGATQLEFNISQVPAKNSTENLLR